MPFENGVYRTPTNEDRADWGSQIRRATPDWGSNDLETDITDALADVVHYLHRCGLDPLAVFHSALSSAEGDLEDGPEARLDPSIETEHGNR